MSKEQCQLANELFYEKGKSPFEISEELHVGIKQIYTCIKEANGRTES